MAHECDDCGESFDTLSRLRLHDCEDEDKNNDGFEIPGLSDDRDATIPELDEQIEAVSEDTDAVYRMVGTFDSALETALEQDGGDTYRDIWWSYYEDVADTLDIAAQKEDWSLLLDVAEAYSPTIDEEVSLGTPAIQNAIGRHIVRTRVNDGVEKIPPQGLDFLADVIEYAVDGDDTAREEAQTFGWGIGHPEYPVADTLQQSVSEYPHWMRSAVEQAIYADQYAAIDLLERIATEESVDGSIYMPTDSLARYMLGCVAGPDSDEYWPTIPRYWDWHKELDYEFEWDSNVEQQIRTIAEETGVDENLSDQWTFQDLMV